MHMSPLAILLSIRNRSPQHPSRASTLYASTKPYLPLIVSVLAFLLSSTLIGCSEYLRGVNVEYGQVTAPASKFYGCVIPPPYDKRAMQLYSKINGTTARSGCSDSACHTHTPARLHPTAAKRGKLSILCGFGTLEESIGLHTLEYCLRPPMGRLCGILSGHDSK